MPDSVRDAATRTSSRLGQLAVGAWAALLLSGSPAALQDSGEAFFRHTGLLAAELERALGVRLDYLADRHELAHPELPPDPEADAVDFTRLSVTPAERAAALGVVDLVFDRLEEQFDQSLRLVGAA